MAWKALKRRYKRVCIVIIILLSSILIVNNYYSIYVINIGASNRFDKEPGTFRVMTLNFDCSGPDTIPQFRRDSLIRLIASVQPDLLCTQEISIERFPELREGLDSIFGYSDSFGVSEDALRFVVYSRFPLSKLSRYACLGDIDTTGFAEPNYVELAQNRAQMTAYSIDVDLPKEKSLTLFSLHLRSNAYSTARREMKDAPWMKGIPMYYNNYMIGKRIRDYQAKNIRRHIDSLQTLGREVMLAGDFNDWNGSYCLNTIMGDDLKDAWSEHGNGFGFTYAGWNLRLRLDHVLYPDSYKLTNVFVADSDISDHRALVADFLLKK